MNQNSIKIIGFILSIVGIVILISLISNTINTFSVISDGHVVEGVVSKEDFIQFNEEDSYVYTISYKVDGLIYYTKTKNNTSLKKYNVGEIVSVYYDVDNPMKSLLNNNGEKYNGLILKSCLTLVFLLLGIFFIFKNEQIYLFFKSFKSDD